MMSVAECAEHAGLTSSELILGPALGPKHHALLATYMQYIAEGAAKVRDLICADLKSALALHVNSRAADLLLVLRLFLTERPRETYFALLEVAVSAEAAIDHDRIVYLPLPRALAR